MTKTSAAYTALAGSVEAGRHLGAQIREAFDGEAPDGVIVFASSSFDYEHLLEALSAACAPKILVGSSSAGEFAGAARGEGTACALAIRSKALKLSASVGLGVNANLDGAARSLVAGFKGVDSQEYPYRTALIMTDALAGHADELVDRLTLLTAGRYQFAGGGAGDDAKFSRTHVFLGTKTYSDAVVGLEFISEKPLGIGVGHGWTPASRALRVTEVEGTRVKSLNGVPTVEAFEEHAHATGQLFDRANPLPFFLHNILGIDLGVGHRLRVPLAVNEDGSVTCAAEIPGGARVYIMRASADSVIAAASNATASAVEALQGEEPGAALFFDCVATRLRMGDVFGFELDSVAQKLGGAKLVGCNTYGQIAHAEGQFGGFHNCTAVVMVVPT